MGRIWRVGLSFLLVFPLFFFSFSVGFGKGAIGLSIFFAPKAMYEIVSMWVFDRLAYVMQRLWVRSSLESVFQFTSLHFFLRVCDGVLSRLGGMDGGVGLWYIDIIFFFF